MDVDYSFLYLMSRYLRELTKFLNEKYPTLHSILDLDIDKTEREWLFWLEQQGIATHKKIKNALTYVEYTPIIYILRTIHSNLFALTDTREELEKDRWDVRILHDKYGINYEKSSTNYYLISPKLNKLIYVNMSKDILVNAYLSKEQFLLARLHNYLKVFTKFFFNRVFIRTDMD